MVYRKYSKTMIILAIVASTYQFVKMEDYLHSIDIIINIYTHKMSYFITTFNGISYKNYYGAKKMLSVLI